MKANMSELNAALQSTLQNDVDVQAFVSDGIQVLRDEPVNVSPDRVPWICTYRRDVNHDPHTLGPEAQAWRANEARLTVIAQYAGQTGSIVSDKLDELVTLILHAIMKRGTALTNYVGMVSRVHVAYAFEETDTPSLYMQSALIEITAEVDHEA